MSAARRKSGRPAGSSDWFDCIEGLDPIASRRSMPSRRPYNEWGKEGKFAAQRYPVGDLRRDWSSESEKLASARCRPVVPAKVNLLKSSELAKGWAHQTDKLFMKKKSILIFRLKFIFFEI